VLENEDRIILETKESEKAWNAVRFANTALKNAHEIKLFLMGEAVECTNLSHERYNVKVQLKELVELKGTVLACGTCLQSRGMEGSDVCPISTMIDCLKMVEWADKVLTF